jgi:ATP/maltotriose-dependent transcriptional regulator MalT
MKIAEPLAGILQDSFVSLLLAVFVGWLPVVVLSHLDDLTSWMAIVLPYAGYLSAAYVYIMRNNVKHVKRHLAEPGGSWCWLARDALEQLAKTTQPCGTEFALGIEARCRALLSDGKAAEELYREAIERLRRTKLRPELARAHLLYGEWLRRENRRVEAREQLRTAHQILVAIGMEAFAERARKELQATGEKVRKRTVETRDDLTAQERQIARLARDGLSNPEIGARLFLSSRTVEWHLRNVFTKLGIRSRRELANALAGPDSQPIPA